MFIQLILAASTPGVYYAYTNSDGVGKGIVVLLLIGSVFTWSVMIDKGMALYRARQCSNRFLARFRANKKNIATPQLVREGSADPGPIGAIYSAGVERLLEFYESDSRSQQYSTAISTRPSRLSDAQYNAIEAVLEREVSSQIQQLETRIGFLATLVSVSPFCGLFGTVWGVMLAFCGIAAAGKSDFTALAPGVAGALLTTVAGLIVAIPSLVGYNLLTATIRTLTITMDNFTEEFMVRIKLEQLELDQAEREEKEAKAEQQSAAQPPVHPVPAQPQPVRAYVPPRPQPQPVYQQPARPQPVTVPMPAQPAPVQQPAPAVVMPPVQQPAPPQAYPAEAPAQPPMPGMDPANPME